MSNKYSPLSSAMHTFLKASALASIAFCTTIANVSAQSIPKVWESEKYQPPFGLQSPGNLSQGGTRSGSDAIATQRFIPLVPQNNNFGVTTEAYPSILVYVSNYVEEANVDTLEFLLLDDEGNEVYRARFAVELTDQLLRIELPKYAGLAPLEEGQDYLWLLEGFTQDFTLSETLFTHGWIRRVPQTDTLAQSLEASSSAEDVANAYINEQIWYDAIAKLEEGFDGNSASGQNITAQWDALLNAAGVSEIALETEAVVTK
ncbi:protein of unknown function DUF928 [[Leptolyngbya] sp. PCC 7376]|uniref:DUF928 domain-containing protein n=1 Tax=[Leptolyngbya] sp. PCC 7376 TaxID=111781 RepID=UPI00029EFAF7|nr:DUF928 domain-containing protein [[Leptolyngbya] sp. PCC 7376]AFY37369.1 protein of unknown function DUF928 [[Leptolyngbya] sp. PCC 7376]